MMSQTLARATVMSSAGNPFTKKWAKDMGWPARSEIPAVITAVLHAHANKAAGKAVVGGEAGKRRTNQWLEAGRSRWIH